MVAKITKNRSGLWGHVIRWCVILILILIALFFMLENNISQVILDMAYADAYALAVEVLNQGVANVMKTGVSYDDLMQVRMDGNGRITMLQANTICMNQLAAQTALAAQEALSQQENQYIYLPLGAALGVNFLAGSGPELAVKIVPVGSVSTQFATEFESAGINQTRHKIYLALKATVQVVIPTGTRRVDVATQVSIAESIIVGDVPDSFVDVNNQEDMLNLLP